MATTALTVCLVSCASFDHLTQVSHSFPRAKECGKCHVDIYHEWSESDHAHAYTNPHFQAATDDYSFHDCLNCHAPEPLLTRKAPAVRSAYRMEGVTRKVTQATGGMSNVLVAMEKEAPQRRHGFQILNNSQPPELITLTATRSGSALEIRIENHLPHDLPTGDFGFRIVTQAELGFRCSQMPGSRELLVRIRG